MADLLTTNAPTAALLQDSNAEPAKSEELDKTVEMIKSFGRRSEGIQADIRDITALPKSLTGSSRLTAKLLLGLWSRSETR